MATMIERMAEALWNSNKPQGAPDYEGLSNVDQFQVELIARDVLKAMKDPDPEIFKKEGIHDNCHMCGGHLEGWNNIIDACLKEGED